MAVALVAFGMAATPLVAGAAPLTAEQIFEPIGSYRFCAEAQLDIANIDEELMIERGISITNVLYGNYFNDFQYSKSAVDIDTLKIVTVESIVWRDAAQTEPRTLRCKMRTGESLNKGAWPAGAENNSPRFVVDPYYGFGETADGVSTNPVDQECRVVNQRTIDNVWSTLSAEQQAASPYSPEGDSPTLVTTPDSVAAIGPEWLANYPTLAVSGDTLQVRSKALVSPSGASGIPRFEGAHYCTFVAPTYLRDVLLGETAVS